MTLPTPTDSAPRLPDTHRSAFAAKQLASFHRDFVDEVKALVDNNDIVVVGMAQNPVVKKARRLLAAAGLPYAYIGHGNYLMGYRRRLAIKLWSGWPWFPMVFVKGVLIGGASDLEKELEKGILRERLAAPRPG